MNSPSKKVSPPDSHPPCSSDMSSSALELVLPQLAQELIEELLARGHDKLASQLTTSTVRRVTFDNEVMASYIYLETKPHLPSAHPPEVLWGETLEVETKYWTLLDVDEETCITGIEILSPLDLEDKLRHLSSVLS